MLDNDKDLRLTAIHELVRNDLTKWGQSENDYIPSDAEFRALSSALDNYFARKAASPTSCGFVEANHRARSGCQCQACQAYRQRRNARVQARRHRTVPKV